MVELLSAPSEDANITMTSDENESIELFGKTFDLGRRKMTLISPAISNLEDIQDQIKKGNEPIIKVDSSVGRLVLEYI